jgi:ferredoxin
MQVTVDQQKCQGHNRCYALAPELFDVDDYGIAHAIGNGIVPAGLEEKAQLAVRNCPEYAIQVLTSEVSASEAERSEKVRGG